MLEPSIWLTGKLVGAHPRAFRGLLRWTMLPADSSIDLGTLEITR